MADTLGTMIVPDDKDWTWVLDRGCPECGFDASTCPAGAVPDLLRANATSWQELLREGAVRPGRPRESTWSSLEYACHVRDVYARYAQRIELMLTEDDPLYPNWDQDVSAVEERYDDQDPVVVVGDLGAGAEALAQLLETIPATAWARRGRRSDGASFTVDSISRYMIHDPIHHVWDVTASLR
jgi:hypothetical protein